MSLQPKMSEFHSCESRVRGDFTQSSSETGLPDFYLENYHEIFPFYLTDSFAFCIKIPSPTWSWNKADIWGVSCYFRDASHVTVFPFSICGAQF